MKFKLLTIVLLALVPTTAWAVSPPEIAGGAQLFTQEWQPHNSALGGDGLGPLFNATSCATCHQQGGIGGGGEAAFNATSIGIDSIEVYGRRVTLAVLANLVSQFHPGFVQPDGNVANVAGLPHHGGSSMLRGFHEKVLQQAGANYADEGGPTEAAEVRIANGNPIVFDDTINGYRIRIKARMYSRNTTALFGSGLIDQVSDKQLDRQVRLQKKHPEISGRPSTLQDGRYGKFGWRANIASLIEFNDQACANEMGLQTRRKVQTSDSTVRGYQNTSSDISDEQIEMLTHFTAALPAPRQSIPSDSAVDIRRGEALFNEVGCNVCHVADMPPASGLYSDLLLHDMGRESIDLSHAEPYIVRRELVTKDAEILPEAPAGFTASTAYYGNVTMMPITFESPRGYESSRPAFTFQAPSGPTTLVTSRLIDSKVNPDIKNNTVAIARSFTNQRSTSAVVRTELREKMKLQPTNFNQEWRTAPLWGVRDSAPYWHDGRAETLLEAIAMHDGEAAGTRDRYLNLSYEDRQSVLAFLESLVAP
ncbi:di-heme oxidoredictase family protein [Allorhodopirellula solitaria]|uniref:Cytochrome c domain-containing protein n=1 Tax=Allorhodopirellula solitaria TaxID=2527987 RepID=A0A5C5XV95_9BACT|nr:di-heme oxidoredictase family protein [Allorhodopirellula solitaria]TWT66491.1 hypothetical protein CA85_25860 [Allorhodopirellula solitaria]